MDAEREIESIDAGNETGMECWHKGFSRRDADGDEQLGGVEYFCVWGVGYGGCDHGVVDF